MPRTYVDNAMNRSLGRVGMEVGTAVHSRSSSGMGSFSSYSESPRTYVDNAMNRGLGRVGMQHGTAVHSSSSSSSWDSRPDHVNMGFAMPAYCSSSSSSRSETPKTYVDNAVNRSLGRVGMEHGTAIHSRSSSSSWDLRPDHVNMGFAMAAYCSSSSSSRSETPKTYVDNAVNRSLGRVGMEHGTAVHSSSSSHSETPKTYVDNAMNRKLGRVGMEYGKAVDSSSSYRTEDLMRLLDTSSNKMINHTGKEDKAATQSRSKTDKVYVDNAVNRKLGRVGLKYGTAVHSRASSSQSLSTATYDGRKDDTAVKSKGKPKNKVYVDNAYNRKHNRVGLPLGSAPISKSNAVYRDTLLNQKLGRASKPLGTQVIKQNNMAALYYHLENHHHDEVPAEVNDLSEDTINYIMEFRQREEAVDKFFEETASTNWQPHQHTSTEIITRYSGKIIDFEKLKDMREIGHGGFGTVYFATLDGESVAVKKLKFQQVTKKRRQIFVNEIELFCKLNHHNVVSFLGACTEAPNLAIVMEYMDMSLHDAIHVKEVDFTVDDKLEIVNDVTNGMAYLHDTNIAHCDLKPQNVLLINVPGERETDNTEPVLAKITDFGLSKMKSDMETSTSLGSAILGTPRYVAPEIHQGKILTVDQLKKADIYSLGLLIWELAVEEIPLEDLNYPQLRVQVGEKGLTPKDPENMRVDRKLRALLSLCWSMDANKRPSATNMAEIARTFTTLLEGQEE